MQTKKQLSIKGFVLPAIALCAVLSGNAAHAALLSYAFEGAVSEVTGVLFPTLNTGLTMTGNITFDSRRGDVDTEARIHRGGSSHRGLKHADAFSSRFPKCAADHPGLGIALRAEPDSARGDSELLGCRRPTPRAILGQHARRGEAILSDGMVAHLYPRLCDLHHGAVYDAYRQRHPRRD